MDLITTTWTSDDPSLFAVIGLLAGIVILLALLFGRAIIAGDKDTLTTTN